MSAPRRRRWELVAGPRYRPPDLSHIDAAAVHAGEGRTVAVTYFDTEDLRLTRWGCQLCHVSDEGWILTLGRAGTPGPQHVDPQLRFHGAATAPPDAAGDLVTALTRGAPLRAVLRTRLEYASSSLSDEEGSRVADIIDERVIVLEGRRIVARFRDISLVEYEDGPQRSALIDGVLTALRDAGAAAGGHGASTVLRALGPAAAQPPDVHVQRASRREPARAAVRTAIAGSVARLIRHDTSVRIGHDPEGVHQARVATRRLRSDLRTFLPLLDGGWTLHLREDLHSLGDLLGTVRDADVLLSRLTAAVNTLPERDRPGAEPALTLLTQARTAARTELLASIRSPMYTTLLDELAAAAADPSTLPEADGVAATLLPPLAARSWRKLRRRVRSLPDPPSDAELHEVRILAKRARYAAEAVAPVAPRSVAGFAKAVAALQDGLGEHHDAVVAEQWLREAIGRGADPLVVGQLVGLERARAAAARAAWPTMWKAVCRARPSSWT